MSSKRPLNGVTASPVPSKLPKLLPGRGLPARPGFLVPHSRKASSASTAAPILLKAPRRAPKVFAVDHTSRPIALATTTNYRFKSYHLPPYGRQDVQDWSTRHQSSVTAASSETRIWSSFGLLEFLGDSNQRHMTYTALQLLDLRITVLQARAIYGELTDNPPLQRWSAAHGLPATMQVKLGSEHLRSRQKEQADMAEAADGGHRACYNILCQDESRATQMRHWCRWMEEEMPRICYALGITQTIPSLFRVPPLLPNDHLRPERVLGLNRALAGWAVRVGRHHTVALQRNDTAPFGFKAIVRVDGIEIGASPAWTNSPASAMDTGAYDAMRHWPTNFPRVENWDFDGVFEHFDWQYPTRMAF